MTITNLVAGLCGCLWRRLTVTAYTLPKRVHPGQNHQKEDGAYDYTSARRTGKT